MHCSRIFLRLDSTHPTTPHLNLQYHYCANTEFSKVLRRQRTDRWNLQKHNLPIFTRVMLINMPR